MRTERTEKTRASLVGLAVLSLLAVTGMGCREEARDASTAEVTVHVGKITRATLHRYVVAFGRVEPAPSGPGVAPARAIIGAPVSGLLARVRCSEGQKVAEGAILFELDNREAEAAVARARTTLDYAEKTLERRRELLAAGGASRRAVQDAEQQRDAAANELAVVETQLDLLRITSPISGTVVRIDAALGQPVEPNTVLAEVIDLDRLVVQARVPSVEVRHLEIGQRIELADDGSPLGRLVFVGNDIDPASDSVDVRASVPAGSEMRPGQFVEIRVVTDERPDCVAVPTQSVVSRAGEGTWIVLVEGGTAVRQPVATGLREGGLVEITGQGLEEGAVIVTDDAYALPAEVKVRVVGS